MIILRVVPDPAVFAPVPVWEPSIVLGSLLSGRPLAADLAFARACITARDAILAALAVPPALLTGA